MLQIGWSLTGRSRRLVVSEGSFVFGFSNCAILRVHKMRVAAHFSHNLYVSQPLFFSLFSRKFTRRHKCLQAQTQDGVDVDAFGLSAQRYLYIVFLVGVRVVCRNSPRRDRTRFCRNRKTNEQAGTERGVADRASPKTNGARWHAGRMSRVHGTLPAGCAHRNESRRPLLPVSTCSLPDLRRTAKDSE